MFMKKIVCLMILILIPNVLAISSDLGNKTFQPSETMVIELFGNILEPIEKEDIELKRKNVQVPWEYDVKRLGDKWFIYGVVPQNENNYSLIINEIATTENGQQTELDHVEKIIVSGTIVDYTLKPGLYITEEEMEFNIFLNEDFPKEITIDFPEEHYAVLEPGSNDLKISFSGIEPGFRRINIGMYNIPILVLGEEINEVESNFPRLLVAPVRLERVVYVEEEVSYRFVITNEEEQIIDDVIIDYDENIFVLEPYEIGPLDPGESFEFTLRPISHNDNIDEIIYLRRGQEFMEIPVVLEFTQDREEIPTEESSQEGRFYCSELGGTVCVAGDVCSGETVSSLDAASCCIGECIIPEEGASYSWVGWLIGMIVVIILIIVAGRYMKTRRLGKMELGKSPISLKKP